MSRFIVTANYVDIPAKDIYPAKVTIQDRKILSVEKTQEQVKNYILPGFIDAHVHIESSMLVPSAFARMAVVHGTVATVSDPHEIANVNGIDGVQYMIDDSKRTPFKFFFGAPSCVPATNFETAGATIDAKGIEQLLAHPDIWYLAEMMNYPGVLFNDSEVMAKIEAAKKADKPIDGHAPGLKGNDAGKYASAGITTDHECFTLEEAQDKLAAGMKIIIREGSAARNFDALEPLFKNHTGKLMFCSDDKHPDELILSHINALVKRAIANGHNKFDVLKAACVTPVEHYNLPVGQLKEGDPADFILVDDLEQLNILATYINGEMVADNGRSLIDNIEVKPINNFFAEPKKPEDFLVSTDKESPEIRVIEALDGQLITNEITAKGKTESGYIISDVENDILKMAVINRYDIDAPIATAFIKNFGLRHGAIASTVGHDCHNIIAVGVDDGSMSKAVNALIECKGGISVTDGNNIETLPLPIAGLMSDKDGETVARLYAQLDKKAKELGSTLRAPFMTLSFMALLVIPSLKLSDKGLFNGSKFEFTPVIV